MNARTWAAAASLVLSGTLIAGLPSTVSQAQSSARTPDEIMQGRVARLERQVNLLLREVERLKSQQQIITYVPAERPESGVPPDAVPFKEFNGTQYYIYPLKKDGSAPQVTTVVPARPAK